MFREYVAKKFRKDDLQTINLCNAIIGEYSTAITLRQLYYQFVGRGIFPNRLSSYNFLKRIVSEGRLAGLISWEAIEDRGRNLMGHVIHKSPKDGLLWLRAQYKRDLWEDQPIRPEVWVEKQALEGVIGQICDELRVNFFATRGYNSQSEQWSAGRRFAGYIQKGQRPIVIHLGDHDPSGIDMTRDNRERLQLFAGFSIMVHRIALNMDQINHWRLPPNPAKNTDARFEDYRAEFGDESWELDALSPDQIQHLIKEAIDPMRDEALWEAALAKEAIDLNDLDVMIEEM